MQASGAEQDMSNRKEKTPLLGQVIKDFTGTKGYAKYVGIVMREVWLRSVGLRMETLIHHSTMCRTYFAQYTNLIC